MAEQRSKLCEGDPQHAGRHAGAWGPPGLGPTCSPFHRKLAGAPDPGVLRLRLPEWEAPFWQHLAQSDEAAGDFREQKVGFLRRIPDIQRSTITRRMATATSIRVRVAFVL